MKFPWQAKEPQVRLPFAIENVTSLKSAFHAAIEQALLLRSQSTLSVDDVWNSSFFSSYVIGYPSYLEIRDKGLMLHVRELMMSSCFDANRSEIIARFNATRHLIKIRRDGVFEAWRLGDFDGKNYFKALLRGDSAGDNAFLNLRLTVRGAGEFTSL